MRSNGNWKSRSSAKQSCALMNMAPPPSAYQACNIALSKAAKAVAIASIHSAANESCNVKFLEIKETRKLTNVAVLCDHWDGT